MKSRPALLLLALVTALVVGTMGVAQAAAPSPVLAVSLDSQTQGTNHTWVVGFSWAASAGADSYRVAITDHDGYNSAGSHYASGNTQALNATLATGDLIAGNTYWITVRALTGSEDSTATTQAFTAIALDTTGPIGTYTANKTVSYIERGEFDLEDFGDEESAAVARVKITQTGLSDDTTPTGDIVRKVLNGDGTPARAWSGTTPIELQYATVGTFSPRVELTDAAGNVTLVVLPGIQIRKDTTAPTVRITTPANATKVASWRRISGVTTDIGTGVIGTQVAVLLKRPDGYWYVYKFGARKFVKGRKTLMGTYKAVRFSAFFSRATPTGAWKTPVINGLGKGKLRIMAFGLDRSLNDGYVVRTQAIS